MPKGYSYIASPYSSGFSKEMTAAEASIALTDRYNAVRDFTAWCLAKKIFVYSPIVHCHDLAREHNLPKDAAFWKEFNEAMILGAQRLIVLCIDGWKESKGVQEEIAMARELWYPISLAKYNEGFGVDRYIMEHLPLKGSHRKSNFLD